MDGPDGCVSLPGGWNRTLRMIPSDAKYCKIVHADDTLLPHCLERMTEVAERNPSVAIVTSYALWGDDVRHLGVPYPVEVVDGRDVCRSTLLGRYYVFGSPSSLLLRATDIRTRPTFYNDENFHSDTEVCFDLLRDADLGFVHQILTRTRVHEEAMTSFAVSVNTFHHGWLAIHLKYGREFLKPQEYYGRLAYRLCRYAVYLAKSVIKAKFRDPRFRKHHGRTLRFLFRSAASRARRAEERSPVRPQTPLTDDGEHRTRRS